MRSFVCLAMFAVGTASQAVSLIELSIPVNSMDAFCEPFNSGVWSLTGNPVANNIGIGWLVNPNPSGSSFVMHDHQYTSVNVPDPTRSIVTFRFGQAVHVIGLQVVEHTNGITKIEGMAGNSLGSMTSIGNVFGSKGDVTGGGQFSEFETNSFSFGGAATGQYFQAVIRKSSLADGYALYRMHLTVEAVPEPTTLGALGLGLAAILRRRR